MIRFVFSLCVLGFVGTATAYQDSVKAKLTGIDTRESGHQVVYISKPIPSEGCTNEDRAILVPGSAGYSDFISAALSALATQKDVILRVDGCTPIDVGSASTSPKIVRILIRNPVYQPQANLEYKTSQVDIVYNSAHPDGACVQLSDGEVAFLDLTTENGKAQLSLAMAAAATGKYVTAGFDQNGTLFGGCNTGTTLRPLGVLQLRREYAGS